MRVGESGQRRFGHGTCVVAALTAAVPCSGPGIPSPMRRNRVRTTLRLCSMKKTSNPEAASADAVGIPGSNAEPDSPFKSARSAGFPGRFGSPGRARRAGFPKILLTARMEAGGTFSQDTPNG